MTIKTAIDFAIAKHDGQIRKYSENPYHFHVLAVASLVERFYETYRPDTDPTNPVVAAVLHDVVEDTDVTLDEIRELFGETVATYVDYLTKTANTAAYIPRLAKAPEPAKIIKYFDMMHNYHHLDAIDPDFYAKKKPYCAEIMEECAVTEIPDLVEDTIDFYNKITG